MSQKRIDKRTRRRPRRRMDNCSRRLVDDDQFVILEHHVQRNVLRRNVAVHRIWHRNFKSLTCGNSCIWFDHWNAIAHHCSTEDQTGQP